MARSMHDQIEELTDEWFQSVTPKEAIEEYYRMKKLSRNHWADKKTKSADMVDLSSSEKKDRQRILYKKWRNKNPEDARRIAMGANKKYNEEEFKKFNREKNKRWRDANPEKAKALYKRGNAKKLSTIKGRLTNSFRGRIYQTLKSPPSKRGHKWEKILGYTIDDLISHIEHQFLSGMNWDNHAVNGWHIDHIITIATFDYESYLDKSFQICWSLPNLRPLWGPDNWARDKEIPIPELCASKLYRGVMDCKNISCQDCCFGSSTSKENI